MARWERVPTTAVDQGVVVTLPRGDLPLKARCPGSQPPTRTVDGLSGPWSTPVLQDEWWVFAPGPRQGHDHLLPAGCEVAVLRSRPDALRVAQLELSGLLDWEDLDLPQRAWVLGAPPDHRTHRWLALRPPGPWPSGWSELRFDGATPERARLGPDLLEQRWWRGQPSLDLRGPVRVHLSAHRVGGGELCLRVDDQRHCTLASLDEGELSSRRAWSLLLGRGTHHIALEAPAVVRATRSAPWTLLPTEGGWPPQPLVSPARPAPSEISAIPAPGVPVVLVLGPDPQPALARADDVRWTPEPGPEQRWLDQGHLRLWLVGGQDCTLDLGGHRQVSVSPERQVSLVWTGQGQPELPVAEGCELMVRVTGPGPAVASAWHLPAAGQVVRWQAPEQAVLWLAAAPGATSRAQINGEDYLLEVPADAPTRETDQGLRLGPGTPVSVPAGPLEVHTLGGVALRLTTETPLPPSPPESVAEPPPPPEPGALRQASLSLALASEAERPLALLERAEVLQALGEHRLAWLDAERALVLAPQLEHEDRALTRALAREQAALLAGPDRWVISDPVWVDPLLDPTAAARGDYLALTTAADPRIWWRRAIVSGQVLTAEQRVRAYRDLVVHSPPEVVDHPWLWPLRLLTGWESVTQVRGATRQQLAWPQPEEELDLSPEPWPDAVSLQRGWELRLPARARASEVAARCLPTRVSVPEACTVEVLDGSGEVLGSTALSPWGAEGAVGLPASSTSYLRVREEGVQLQLQLPTGLPLDRQRSGWALRAGGRATAEVLGPTVLQVYTDAPLQVMDQQLQPGVHRIPLDQEGPIPVSLRALDRPARFLVELRVPRARSLALVEDTAPTSLPAPPPADEHVSVGLPEGRPLQEPRATATAELRVGSSPEEVQAEVWVPGISVRQGLGVESRPNATARWWQAGVGLEESAAGLHLTEAAGLDWRLRSLPTRVWLVGDLWGVQALGGTPLGAVRARVRLQADQHLRPSVQAVAQVEVRAQGALAYQASPELPSHLWNGWRDAHPLGLSPRAELRLLHPWRRLVLSGQLTTNPSVLSVDHLSLGLRGDLARPGARLSLAAVSEHYLVDDLRYRALWQPQARTTGELWLWPHRDAGLSLFASASYRPIQGEVLAQAGLRGRLSRDRALDDQRPSDNAFRHVGAWGQERAAQQVSP